MSTIADPATLAQLIARLNALQPGSSRRWGAMTAGEMLCHLADVHLTVMDPSARRPAPRWRPVMKWIALYAPLPWPKGFKSPARVDQRKGGTKPTTFEADRQRALGTLRTFAAVPPEALPPNHAVFGTLSAGEWHRWAYRHTDHHLRQFGL
ncbi:MAG: DinB family protein [Holophagaceae bacterium]|nr:DinB family protein [Holophagaceae bacterium]